MNGEGDFLAGLGIFQHFDNREAEGNGGAGASGGNGVAIDDDDLGGVKVRKLPGDALVPGKMATLEDTGLMKNDRSGTDCGDPGLAPIGGAQEVEDAVVLPDALDSGTSGKEDGVEGGGVHILEGGIGVNGNPVAALDMNAFSEVGGRDGDSGPTQEVDRGEGFDFFHAGMEEDEAGGLFGMGHVCGVGSVGRMCSFSSRIAFQ